MRKKIKCLSLPSYLFRVTVLPLYFILLSQNVKNCVVSLRSFSLWYSTTTTLLKALLLPRPRRLCAQHLQPRRSQAGVHHVRTADLAPGAPGLHEDSPGGSPRHLRWAEGPGGLPFPWGGRPWEHSPLRELPGPGVYHCGA